MSHYVYLSQSAKSTFIYNYKKYLLQRDGSSSSPSGQSSTPSHIQSR